MNDKSSKTSIDINELKEQMKQLKEVSAKAKKEYEEKKATGEIPKPNLGQKIITIVFLAIVVALIGYLIITNIDILLLPENSVTIIVTDENNEAINGLKVHVNGDVSRYTNEFIDISNYTILGVKPGEYTVTLFEPSGYTCSKDTDTFTLNQDGKIKLKYICTKEN